MQNILNNLVGSQININGGQYSGKSVRIENGKVYVDGNLVKGTENDKVINILIEGNVDRIDVEISWWKEMPIKLKAFQVT
jgi:hypothetical protein